MFYYRGFSLNIGSELPLPELPEAEGEPDILIRLGRVPGVSLTGSNTNELAIHNVAGVFHIKNGSEIVVDPKPGADPTTIRLLLLGRMMAYLLRQRGWLPLHAGAVAVKGKGVLFLGYSGAGKSTTTAAFHIAGYPVLTDDVAPVRVADGRCVLLPARPRVRLDANSRILMEGQAVQGVLEWDDKYRFELPRHSLPEAVAVQRIYVIEDGEKISSQSIPPVEAVRFLSAHCFFRRRWMDTEAVAAHVRNCAAVASIASVRHLTRPRLLEELPRLVDFVENDLANA
jgi:hypothetical protein